MASDARAQDLSVMVGHGGNDCDRVAGVAAAYDERSYLPIQKEHAPRLQLMLKIGHIQGGHRSADLVSGVG